jgi:hypothetical protein
MNLPSDPSGEPADDRRAVPRHIRDAEHDMIEEPVSRAGSDRGAARRMGLWICLAILAAGGFGLWLAARTG